MTIKRGLVLKQPQFLGKAKGKTDSRTTSRKPKTAVTKKMSQRRDAFKTSKAVKQVQEMKALVDAVSSLIKALTQVILSTCVLGLTIWLILSLCGFAEPETALDLARAISALLALLGR
jgi:hypothetical protein